MNGLVRFIGKGFTGLPIVSSVLRFVFHPPQFQRTTMSQSQLKIDDQDLSLVKYNGTWIRGGSPNEYDGTVASSTHVGDSFTVSFTGKMSVNLNSDSSLE